MPLPGQPIVCLRAMAVRACLGACINDFLQRSGAWSAPTAAWRTDQDANVGRIIARAKQPQEGCNGLARHIEHYWQN